MSNFFVFVSDTNRKTSGLSGTESNQERSTFLILQRLDSFFCCDWTMEPLLLQESCHSLEQRAVHRTKPLQQIEERIKRNLSIFIYRIEKEKQNEQYTQHTHK
jgi:hypothetical protein